MVAVRRLRRSRSALVSLSSVALSSAGTPPLSLTGLTLAIPIPRPDWNALQNGKYGGDGPLNRPADHPHHIFYFDGNSEPPSLALPPSFSDSKDGEILQWTSAFRRGWLPSMKAKNSKRGGTGRTAAMVAMAACIMAGCGQPKWPATAPLTEAEMRSVLSALNYSNTVDWLEIGLAGQPENVRSQVLYRVNVAADKAAVDWMVELYAPGELARRLDTHKRGVSQSGWTSNQLHRAYVLKVQRGKLRKSSRGTVE